MMTDKKIEEIVLGIIKDNNLNITKLAVKIGVARESLTRVIRGSRKAGKEFTGKLQLFLEACENGLDLTEFIKPVKIFRLVDSLFENEVWVVGYKNKYSVTTDGEIYSWLNKGKYRKQLLVGWLNQGGYKQVELSGKIFYAHRIVCTAFHPNPKNLPQVNHISGVKTDNHIENIEWITAEDNINHALLNGLFMGLGVVQIDSNGIVVATYSSVIEASKSTGTDSSSIIKCCRSKRKSAGGFKWQYKKIITSKGATRERKIFLDSTVLWA